MNYILVVDDDKFIADVIKDAIEHFGYKVAVACNGEEGLKYFNSKRFEMVITDIKMPIMDGIEFARSIRNSDRSDTPIIAITAYFDDNGIERNLFNSMIEKPFKLESLEEIISQHLES